MESIKKPSSEELGKTLLGLLDLKVIMEFSSHKLPVPAKPDLKKELAIINPELGKLIEKTKNAKTVKELWKIFYSEIL